MDQLPNELVSKIFLEYSNWNDHAKLSKVCKRFYLIIQHKTKQRINDLSIFLNRSPQTEQMYFGNKSIDYSNSVCLPSITYLFVEEFKNKFKNIEYLLIVNNLDDDLSPCKIDFGDKILNHFDKLKHVELRNITQVKNKLDLPFLESFYISTRLPSTFTILSPNLRKLAHFDKALPILNHTESLEIIAAQTLIRPYIGYGFLNKRIDCPKLTGIIIYEPDQIKWMLNQFQHQLEQVRCIGQLKIREIKELIKTMNDLRLFKLNLFYFGLNLQNEVFRRILDNEPDESIFYIQNLNSEYVRIFSNHFLDFQESIQYVKEINLDDNVHISDEFISKLINLEVLVLQSDRTKLTGLNSEILLKFMNSCTKLIKLNLESIEMEQVHLNLMPIHFQMLNELRIKDCKIDSFDFINRFDHLQTFTTNCDLNIPQITKLLLESCPVRIIFC